MLRVILKCLVIIAVVQGLIFVMICVFITDNKAYNPNIPVINYTSKHAKKIYGSIASIIKKINKHGLSALYKIGPGTSREQKETRGGMLKRETAPARR